MIATRVVLKSLIEERAELEHDLITAKIHRNDQLETELEGDLKGVNTRIERLETLMQRDLQQQAALQARIAQVISPNKGAFRFFVGLGLCAVTAMGGDVHLAWIGGALIGWAGLATSGVTL